MNNAAIIPVEISRPRLIAARFLGVLSASCATLWILTCTFIIYQAVAGFYDGPALGVVVLIFTFAPACVATLVSLMLVGSRHSKLAWVSLCIYPLSFIAALITTIADQPSK